MKRMWDENEIVELCKEVHNKLGIECIVVEELPSPEDARKGVIYLVPSEDGEEGNIYEEYILTSTGFELIGTTEIDLSNYVNLSEAQTITGVKIFSNGIELGTNGINFQSFFYIKRQGANRYSFDNESFSPVGPNQKLGTQYDMWKEIYLSGVLTDGTNSVSVEDLTNLVLYAKTQGWIS